MSSLPSNRHHNSSNCPDYVLTRETPPACSEIEQCLATCFCDLVMISIKHVRHVSKIGVKTVNGSESGMNFLKFHLDFSLESHRLQQWRHHRLRFPHNTDNFELFTQIRHGCSDTISRVARDPLDHRHHKCCYPRHSLGQVAVAETSHVQQKDVNNSCFDKIQDQSNLDGNQRRRQRLCRKRVRLR